MKTKKLLRSKLYPAGALIMFLLLHQMAGSSPVYYENGENVFNAAGFYQQREVTGIVVDEDGSVLAGATIYLKSQPQRKFVADDKGNFKIPVTAANDVIITEAVGFHSSETPITANTTVVRIVLKADVSELDDVVVVGYGTQSRRNITSAVGKIEGKDLESLPVNSVGDAMKGRVAGLRVYTTDHQPGENPTFRIRGGSSINQSDAPIIVVDGVVRDISGINPNDIESIEILKDAASAAIYGARASNGIVLITTKRGKNTSPQILFESTYGFQTPAQQFDLMNAEDYLFYMRRAVSEGKYPARNFQNGFSMSSANSDASMWSSRYLESGEAVPDGWKSMPDPLDPSKTIIFQDVDYQKRFFKNTNWSNYYVGVTGGSDNVKYATSVGYTKDGGIGIATGYDRFTMRGNVDFKITNRLNFSTGYDFARTNLEDYPDNKRNSVQRGLSTPFTHRLLNVETGLPEKGYNGSTPAPDWFEYYNDRGQVTKRNTIYGKLNYQLSDAISFTTILTNFNRHTRGHSFQKANEYSGLRSTSESFSETQRWNYQLYGNIKKNFGDHRIDAVLGYDYMKDDNNSFSASVTGASSDKVPTLSAGAIPGNPSSSVTREVLLSYFSRINYSFMNRYLLTFTMRADGSSKFAPENRWGYFPAASAGWIISEEDFWFGKDWFNFFKLRASYGLTGNNAIGLYDAYGNFSTSGKYDGNATIVTSTIPNNALTWETTAQLDIGFDASFLNSRLTIGGDYFDKVTDNLIFSMPLPNTTGYSSIRTNVGKVKFYGAEFYISSENVKTKDFTWSTDFTYSYIMNRVLKLPENGRDKNRIGGITLADGTSFGGIAEGERMYRIYGYIVDRILETPAEAAAAMYDANSNGFSPVDGLTITGRKNVGDYEWKNRPGSSLRNGDAQINSEDQFLLGYTIPHTTGGMRNNFSYKNFNLNIFMDYTLGHTVQNYLQERYFMGTFNYNYNLTNEVKKAWTKPGDNTPYAKFFANDADDGSRNYSRVQNLFSEKGDFLCIREVTLAYNFPSNMLAKKNIKGLTVYASGFNLYYFTAVNGVSPERGVGSTYDTDYNPYPASRRMALGLKLTL